MKDKILRTRYTDGKTIYPTSDKHRRKRQNKNNGECFFVDLVCKSTPACGVMPKYSMLSKHALPKFGSGVFPWTVREKIIEDELSF